jgi:hypothetical protein
LDVVLPWIRMTHVSLSSLTAPSLPDLGCGTPRAYV